ncbi:pH-response regulator protein palI/RIM9 [Penicillium subrubescens]|uniref:pH-response regulator protein palI/RIM9 n=1 Tax=Penicillium subrubescens TaxID=1316194 RepID=UPI002544F726|nr:pH-response regulator protein palI/RIM9 [Penicillium subrubescens]KAJ5886637.1 pH-response regulator protein palI/RIM9 [Penicillium subrubescens]
MLLKPATPLTILLLIAFALLLLSCLSTPIVKGIPLATFKNVDYGVFGYCQGDQCTNIHVGYTGNNIDSTGGDFNLPSSTRKSLSSILIVHPVAAFLTLVCLCLAGAAHFHGPSHSPRFLLALLILLLPTLLVTLLAFLVDVLLFVPHLRWGGWIVLASTILLVSCGVVTCAMRRTLVSRKARKRRIAENAEMSGENYYNRQNAAAAAVAAAPVATETKEAMVSGSPTSESGPTFATFRTETRTSDDDRTPLNSRNANGMHDVPPPDAPFPNRHGSPYRSPQEEAGVPPVGPYGNPQMMRNPSDPRLRPQYSDGSMGSRRGGAPPGFGPRGRGGYPPRGGYGRGGPYMGPPRGPPGGRGGYMGGPMPPRGRGGMMPGRGGPRGAPGYSAGPNRSFDSYGRPIEDAYDQPGMATGGAMREPSPGPIGMAVSADNVGQAIEMQPQMRRHDPYASEQSIGHESNPHALSVNGAHAPLESPTSLYSSTDSYVPARAGWGAQESDRHLASRPSPSPAHAGTGKHSTNYYEDVDPRFARRPSPQPNSSLPSSLTPGGGHF